MEDRKKSVWNPYSLNILDLESDKTNANPTIISICYGIMMGFATHMLDIPTVRH